MRLRIQSNKKKGNSQPTTGVTRGQSIAVSVRIREITIRKEGGGWGREKSSCIFGRKLVWQVCTAVTITFLRVGVDPGNEVGTAWLHLKTGKKKPSNSPSQAFTIKALLRFYFILFVYLFVYYNYFFGWRGRGGGGGGGVWGLWRTSCDSDQPENKSSQYPQLSPQSKS